MNALLWVAVLAPFAGSLVLALFGASMPRKFAGATGCVSVFISLVMAAILGWQFLEHGARPVLSARANWIDYPPLHVDFGLRLDLLSLAWLEIITFVGLLIHIYASQSMLHEEGYSRFFCYMNLFVGSMLTLVLADNLLLLYLGWEGVGLCSYLLIGFWYKGINNCDSARKAFVVTRVGDTALLIALFILFDQGRTLNIHALIVGAGAMSGSVAAITAFLILGGAVGKSAQLPLQTWLPDAMAGPTPVSALIHAATMVTAGIYIIARMAPLFLRSDSAMLAVAVVGAVTLLYAGLSALAQWDIKRVLAYSTISQIGYMFLAMGVGAWTAAVLHFVTHAFFKALLFLAAGVVIDAQGDEHDIRKMGGLARALPVTFWTFLIGGASLSALPFVTAGFYSKELILAHVAARPFGAEWMLVVGLIGSLITAAYTFRVVFLVFVGEQKMEVRKRPGGLMTFSLVVLAFFSITGFVGWRQLDFGRASEQIVVGISCAIVLLGIYTAYVYYSRRDLSEAVARSSFGRAAHDFVRLGFGFDWLYERMFVIPLKTMARTNRSDFVDSFFHGLAATARAGGYALSLLQTGRVRNYAAALVFGSIVITVILLLR